MLRLGQAVVCITLAAIVGLLPDGRARAEDAVYGIGRQGWSLEYFGADVALLRSAAASRRASADEAVLILSCEGKDRRLRLTFPVERPPPGLAASPGHALIRAIDRTGTVTWSLSTRFAAIGRATMVVTNRDAGGAEDPVLRIARMLQERPIGLDLLLRPDSEPATLDRASPLRLPLAFGPDDGLAFRAFVEACS